MRLRVESGFINVRIDARGTEIDTGMGQIWVKLSETCEVSLDHLMIAHDTMKSIERFVNVMSRGQGENRPGNG